MYAGAFVGIWRWRGRSAADAEATPSASRPALASNTFFMTHLTAIDRTAADVRRPPIASSTRHQ
jgi:hypothetical protein